MKVYKIRDPKTGLFKLRGPYVRWSKNGVLWTGIGPLKLHLKLHNPNRDIRIDPDWEILEYETEPTRIIKLSDLMENR